MIRKFATRVRSLFTRDRMEHDLDRELAFHLDMATEQNLRAGMSPDAARRAAMQHFGTVEGVRDAVRDTWLSRTWEAIAQDVRYGLRGIRRTPGFALVVIVTMALGIGANTAIFSVVNAVLLRPLPYEHGERLVVLRQQRPLAGVEDMGWSATEIADYARQSTAIDAIAEFHSMWFILLGRAEPERVATGVVSASFFRTFGVTPLLGRDFTEADEAHGAPAVLILSHEYWQRSFGGDPSIVGKVFEMDDRPHEVVGVLPPVPQHPEEVDVYMPTSACPFRSSQSARENRDHRMMSAYGRLRDGVTLAKARADLEIVASRLQQDHPRFYPAPQGYRTSATRLQDELTRSFRTTLFVLLGTAAFVLLIVCASIANLTLARMVRRDREMAVRAALGASRTRLVRQLLTESTLLAVIGGTLGLAVAVWGVQLLAAFAERFTTRAQEISIDGTVLLFTLVLSVATGLVFGSVPAFAKRLGTTPALREGGRSTHAAHGIRSGLIVAQVAVSFMLLIGAGLTVRTLYNLQQVDPGVRTDNVLTLRLDLNFTKYSTPQSRAAFWERLDERLREIPGVISVAGAGTFPLNEQGPFSRPLRIEGVQYPADAPRPRVDVRVVSPGYFETLGQPILAGRAFVPSDRAGDSPVVIVNRTMAQHYWPDESPIGRRISGDNGGTWSTIVGMVADARQQLNRPPGDEVFVAMFQGGQLSSNWLIRTRIDATTMTRQVREAIYSIDPQQPADRFRTLDDVRASALESPRLTAILIGLFAALALVITAAGMAGVIAFSVNQRTQEFGLRMALGAQRGAVLGMVLRQGLRLVVIGLAIGVVGALLIANVMTAILFGVEPTDTLTFVVVSAVLVAVAAVACLVPAGRAASVDPMIALRVGMLLLVLGGGVASAAQAPPPADALDGIDTVVLLTQGKEVFGKEQFRTVHGRFAYLFSSAETKAQFDKAPGKYAIQMGGLCARMGKTVAGNPSDYVVHEGKIYIFGSDACHKAFVAAPAKYLPKPAAPMPTGADAVRRGRALLDKASAAIGAGLDRLTSYVETASVVQQRPTGAVTIVSRTMWRFPDGVRSERRLPMSNGETMTIGSLLTANGAWSAGPQGLRPEIREGVPSVQQDLWRQVAPLLRMRNEKGVAVAALAPAVVQNSKVDRVRVRRGGLDVTLNIDPATGRVHSTSFVDRGPGGEIGQLTIVFGDFRTVQGFALAFKESGFFNDTAQPALTRTLDSIAVNAPLDAALFAAPPEKR
jgi:predicted permease